MIKPRIENGREYNLKMEMFIVFLQAFKAIKGDCTVKTLTELRVPAKFVRLAQITMKKTKVRIGQKIR